MTYEFKQKVLFKHCDPAGIVFYPRYFEMINDCIESFFDVVLANPFEQLHKFGGVPTAQIQTRFLSPSRHGDQLLFKLQVPNVGNSSAEYRLSASCDEDPRFETIATLVNVNTNGRPTPWPDNVRAKLSEFKGGTP